MLAAADNLPLVAATESEQLGAAIITAEEMAATLRTCATPPPKKK